MTQEELHMEGVLESMALFLIGLAMDNYGEKALGGCSNGQNLTLKIVDDKGEVGLQVVGADSCELAEQLVLACFHNLSIEHLGALHLQPLNSNLQLTSKKK
jgi:hypothetical protein